MTHVLRDLGDGLLLKQSTSDDVERLADYNARYLSFQGPDQPDEMLKYWTRDLMTNHHSATADDFLYVEDSHSGQIISSLCLIPQTWHYEHIPFGVGRVEMVSTKKEYRRKGLIRAQFEIFHQWSKARGDKMQAITGIPYFYRQFGYEMTLSLGGSRRGYRPHVPALNEDQTEPYRMRQAKPEDIPFINAMYDRGRQRSLISCPRHENVWRYEMLTQHETFRGIMAIIETLAGEALGFIWHSRRLSGADMGMFVYELKEGVSWSDITPTVIRYLKQRGETMASEDDEKEWDSYTFQLGTHHPSYDMAAKYLPEENKPYAWYIRVPDLPDFIRHISPVLDQRLAESEFSGYDGELLLDFHRSGVKLTLEKGTFSGVEGWLPSTDDRGDLAFPPLTFLHLLCGYRSFEELETFYPDCYRRQKPEAVALVNVLFPKKPSYVLGIV